MRAGTIPSRAADGPRGSLPLRAPALIETLDGHSAEPGLATQGLVVVDAAAALAVAAHEAGWAAHHCSSSVARGAARRSARTVRVTTRARGYRDAEVAAVDADLTATRYLPG